MAATATTTISHRSKMRGVGWSALAVAAAIATGSVVAFSLGDSPVGPSEATEASPVPGVRTMSANAAEFRLDSERLGVRYVSANATEHRLGHQ